MAQQKKCYGNWKFGNPLCRGCEVCVYCRDFTMVDRVNTIRRSVPILERDVPEILPASPDPDHGIFARIVKTVAELTDQQIRVFRLAVLGEISQTKVKNLLRCGSDRAAELIEEIFAKFPGLKK